MSNLSEQRYDVVSGPPVTANPLTWFRRPAARAIVPQLVPMVDAHTAMLLDLRERHQARRDMEATPGNVAHYRGLHHLSTLAELIVDDCWQGDGPESMAIPAMNARHAQIIVPSNVFADEVIDELRDSTVMHLDQLSLMMWPMRPESSWPDRMQAAITSAYERLSVARKAHLDFLRYSAPERCCLTIHISYPSHWGAAHNFYVRQLVPVLASMVRDTLGPPQRRSQIASPTRSPISSPLKVSLIGVSPSGMMTPLMIVR